MRNFQKADMDYKKEFEKERAIAYGMIADDTLVEDGETGGIQIDETYSYARHMSVLDHWVGEVLSQEGPAVKWKRTKNGMLSFTHNRSIMHVPLLREVAFLRHTNPDWPSKNNRVSPNLILLFDALEKYPLNTANTQQEDFEALNSLVEHMRVQSQLPEHRENVRMGWNKAVRNQRSLSRYIGALLAEYRRLLVVRIDLTYKAEYKHLIGLEDAQGHLAELLHRRYNREEFTFCVGYAWGLEYGEKKGGYHFHCFFFFQGDKVRDDVFYANRIGQYWLDATSSLGHFHNCNQSKIKYKRNGIGMVHVDDALKRDYLLYASGYLTKRQGYLSLNPPGVDYRKVRTFQHGQLKKKKKVETRGRPRKDF